MTETENNATLADLEQRLLDGIKVLSGEGVMTGSGHLSVRIPGAERYLINPRYAAVLADREDICTVDFSGKRLEGSDLIPLEAAIHTVIYRTRPEVQSVIHCHPRYGILLSLQEKGFVPFSREASQFAGGVPVFPVSRGIHNETLALEMLKTLGDRLAVFLRGHGVVVAGQSIEGAVISAVQLERACRDQLLLMSFTEPVPLGHKPKKGSAAKMEHPYRAWPYLLHKHGLRSKEEVRAIARSMSRVVWADEYEE